MTDDLVKQYRDLQGAVGGCHDGYCVIKKPTGAHTNGGCDCLQDMRLHERSRVGQMLRCAQDMADCIEELEAKLAKAVWAIEIMQDASDAMMLYIARTTLAELKGQTDDT